MKSKFSITYTDTDNKMVREEINLKCDNPDWLDHHMIIFYKCNKKSKKIRKYIEEKGYFYHNSYNWRMDDKRIRVVSIIKLFKGMEENELEQIEGKMIMIKLTQ